jgi:predicted RNase H-like nuclease (RuvC/YqgF family)
MIDEHHDLMDKYLLVLQELNHEKLRREAFERDLAAQVKITDSFAKNVLEIGYEARDLASELKRTNAENARLKAEVERLTAFTTRTIIPNEELQKQVDRLTSTIGAQLVELDDLRAKLRT